MEHSKRVELIKAVFGTPAGKDLLEDLMEEIILNKRFNLLNPNEMYFELGQQALITDFVNTIGET